jgi:hypothetical protein
MSAILYTAPPLVALSKEPILVTLQTDVQADIRAHIDMEFIGIGVNEGDTLTLNWLGRSLEFVFKQNPNLHVPTELPLAMSLYPFTPSVSGKYIQYLAQILQKSDVLMEDFDIKINPDTLKLQLIAQKNTTLSISVVSSLANTTVTATDFTTNFFQPNLSALLKVISPKGREISRHSGDYNRKRLSTLDIHGVFDVAPHLPNADSFNSNPQAAYGVAFKAYQKYFLRFADRYGAIPYTESLERSPYFYTLYGGRYAEDTKPFIPNAAGIYPCYAQFSGQYGVSYSPDYDPDYSPDYGSPPSPISIESIPKIVTKHQPNWLYFFPTQALPQAIVEIFLTLEDGSTTFYWLNQSQDLLAHLPLNRLYYFRTGYEQVGILQFLEALHITQNVVSYKWRLKSQIDDTVYLEQNYAFENCRHNSLYLAYANPFGGIDTLHLRGGWTKKAETERTLIHRFDQVENIEYGTIDTYDEQSQSVWELSTGLLTLTQAADLRLLLTAKLWLIDTLNHRFIRMILDTKSFEIRPKKGGLVSLSLTVKSAYYDA